MARIGRLVNLIEDYVPSQPFRPFATSEASPSNIRQVCADGLVSYVSEDGCLISPGPDERA